MTGGKGYSELPEEQVTYIQERLHKYGLPTPDYLLKEPSVIPKAIKEMKEEGERLNQKYIEMGIKEDPNKPEEPGFFEVGLYKGMNLA